MANAESMCVVYWLKDERCICLWRHGYIGYSTRLRERIKNWRRLLSKPFEYEVLFVGTIKECRQLEYKLRPERFIGWNYLAGGGKSPRAGVIVPEYVRQRMSEAAKKKPPMSAATREKLRIANTGRTNRGRLGQKKSEEERRKISLSQIGKPKSDEHRRKMSQQMIGTAYHLGHLHTDETKQRIRIKKIGVPIHSDEHKRRLAERMKGNTFTKGKPWSAARRIAWLQRKEEAQNADLVFEHSVELSSVPSLSNQRRTPGEFGETPDRTIPSQAAQAEGVTTRAKARRAKRPEAPGPSKEGDEIVSSA
jgi:hypothetical protein